jgi:hypothetical protein
MLPSNLLQQQQEPSTAEWAPNTNRFEPTQLNVNNMYGLPHSRNYVSSAATNLMIANQLQQSGNTTSPFVQLSTTQSLANEQQQLALLLQQHLLGIGLAQSLGLHIPANQTAAVIGSRSNTNPSILLPSSYGGASLQANPATFTGTTQTSHVTTLMNLYGDNSTATVNQPKVSSNNSPDAGPNNGISGRPPILLYLTCDNESLSEYQCLVRKQIEVFEAEIVDVESNAQGRNRPIVLGQVGIRCRHCNMLPPRYRSRGAVYYPAKLQGIYQAAQNIASAHLGGHCQHVPDDVRTNLPILRERKSSAGGGRRYWADSARVLGVYEDHDGLRFESRLNQN